MVLLLSESGAGIHMAVGILMPLAHLQREEGASQAGVLCEHGAPVSVTLASGVHCFSVLFPCMILKTIHSVGKIASL
jgi:hypothetical protein